MPSDPIAQAYAEALFRIAEAEDAVDRVESELYELQKILNKEYELREFLDDPSVTVGGKRSAVAELFAGKVSPLTLNLVYTAVEQGRHRLLPGIVEVFADLASAFRGQVTAEVITAVPLTEEMADKLRGVLSKRVNKKVYLKQMVDGSILGGAIVRIGDKIIDGCVSKKLQGLRSAMIKRL
ncbi:MAG: ATP synthase F1 subunit delta [Gemmatimonadota bacterium]|nr:MAG: ATP synthase F1 subunit delta [Gemmatimonadota bacterium]